MMLNLLVIAFALLPSYSNSGGCTGLQVGVKRRPNVCTIRAQQGDVVFIHYTGFLHDSGAEFDSSLPRGDPVLFTLGRAQVMPGWERGILGMCIGEVRRLIVPPELAYGPFGAPPKIPGNAVLQFDIELLNIERNGRSQL